MVSRDLITGFRLLVEFIQEGHAAKGLMLALAICGSDERQKEHVLMFGDRFGRGVRLDRLNPDHE